MKLLLRMLAIVVLLPVFACANEAISGFSFKTIEGKTIEYKMPNKSPLVVNIAAPW